MSSMLVTANSTTACHSHVTAASLPTSGRGPAERTSVGDRRDTDDLPEVMAQHRRRAEATTIGDGIDRVVALLEHAPGKQHALLGQPVMRRRSRLVAEP